MVCVVAAVHRKPMTVPWPLVAVHHQFHSTYELDFVSALSGVDLTVIGWPTEFVSLSLI